MHLAAWGILRVMARNQRVRQMTTRDLEAEMIALYPQLLFSSCDETGLCDHPPEECPPWRRAMQRWLRVTHELARRDYRFRPHGRRCTCEDCMALLWAWEDTARRGIHDCAPWKY